MNYENGEYFSNNPNWHAEDSQWKGQNILRLLKDNKLTPGTVCEVGCGAGGILNYLSNNMSDVLFAGYEISPQAFSICSKSNRDTISFFNTDITKTSDRYDILLAIDVFEHVEDYYSFLKKLHNHADFQVFHVPLDISVQTVLRALPLRRCFEIVGHLHYFTFESALWTLKNAGFEILDYRYTHGAVDLPTRNIKKKILNLFRRFFFKASPHLTARLFGGYSLLVLTR